MKKTAMIVLGLLTLLSMQLVSAYNTTVPTSVKVNVDFLTSNSFVLTMPNGLEKHYTWNGTTIPPDDSFTHVVYTNLDPESWCGSNTALTQYQNLTRTFGSLTSICSDSMTQYNKTMAATIQAADSDKKYSTCAVDLNGTKTALITLQSKEKKFDQIQGDYLSCQTDLATCKGDQEKLAVCSQDLKKAQDDKNTYMFFAAIAGLGLGWYLWKREKPLPVTGPAEQMGRMSPDFVNVNPGQFPNRRTGKSDAVWGKFEQDDKGPKPPRAPNFPGEEMN